MLCPEDWYLWNGHCYFTANTKKTFDAARQVCKDVNDLAELVSIHDDIEDGKLAEAETKMSYIGLKNDGNSWQWLDSTPVDYEKWDDGQPGAGQCATLKQNGLWQSQECDLKSNFHCKLTACKSSLEEILKYKLSMQHLSSPAQLVGTSFTDTATWTKTSFLVGTMHGMRA